MQVDGDDDDDGDDDGGDDDGGDDERQSPSWQIVPVLLVGPLPPSSSRAVCQHRH